MEPTAAPTARLAALARGTSLDEALAFYDTLPPVPLAHLRGLWRGGGVPTGHPLDGVLEALGWYGKQFDGPDAVHPRVFATTRGERYCIDPAHAPLWFALRRAAWFRHPAARRAFELGARARRTRARARACA